MGKIKDSMNYRIKNRHGRTLAVYDDFAAALKGCEVYASRSETVWIYSFAQNEESEAITSFPYNPPMPKLRFFKD